MRPSLFEIVSEGPFELEISPVTLRAVIVKVVTMRLRRPEDDPLLAT